MEALNIKELDLKIEIPNSKLLTSKVADKIRECIILGNFKPGERLIESKLADSLGVSRQPVREAFRILELEHLITLVPRKGAYIAETSLKETQEIYEIRAMIEGFAAQLAISHITPKDLSQLKSILDLMEKSMRENNFKKVIKSNLSFHQKMINLSQNGNLAKVYESILLPVRRYQKMGLALQSSWEVSLEEHRKILEALSSRDVQRAEEMCRNHVLKAKKRLINCLISSRKGDDKNEYEVYGDVKGS